MNKEFVAALPNKFVENTRTLCGERGEKWLNDLPDTIAELEKEWNITAAGHFRNLSYNYVANASLSDGTPAVIKVALPLNDVEIYGEAAYLQAIDGHGAVECLRFDRERQAVLLERITPGVNLRSECRKDRERAVGVGIDLLKRLLRPVPTEVDDYINLDDWFDGLRNSEGTAFPQDLAERALAFYAELSTDTGNTFLIHGDLHHDNILTAKREKFLAIDPKGMVGHVGYDIGVFLNHHRDWLDWDTRLDGKMDRAVTHFATAFDLEEVVVRKWAFCKMVLTWWWLFDEMPEMFSDELGFSDLWKV